MSKFDRLKVKTTPSLYHHASSDFRLHHGARPALMTRSQSSGRASHQAYRVVVARRDASNFILLGPYLI